jgi:lipoprotein-anchoring transpeptidase ErfK/SrfK
MALVWCRRRIAGAALVVVLVATAAVVGAVVTTSAATAQPVRPASEQAVAGTPCTASARACVDLDRQVAWLLDDGVVVRGPVDITDGDGDTPFGTFEVEWKANHWVSRELGTPMPWSVFFAPGGIAFHQGDLDIPSAGCVKLAEQDAPEFYRYLQVGDEVQVRGTPDDE